MIESQDATSTEDLHGVQRRVRPRLGGHLGDRCDRGQEGHTAQAPLDLRRMGSRVDVGHDRQICLPATERPTPPAIAARPVSAFEINGRTRRRRSGTSPSEAPSRLARHASKSPRPSPLNRTRPSSPHRRQHPAAAAGPIRLANRIQAHRDRPREDLGRTNASRRQRRHAVGRNVAKRSVCVYT